MNPQQRMMLWMTLLTILIVVLVIMFVPQVGDAFRTVFG